MMLSVRLVGDEMLGAAGWCGSAGGEDGGETEVVDGEAGGETGAD